MSNEIYKNMLDNILAERKDTRHNISFTTKTKVHAVKMALWRHARQYAKDNRQDAVISFEVTEEGEGYTLTIIKRTPEVPDFITRVNPDGSKTNIPMQDFVTKGRPEGKNTYS